MTSSEDNSIFFHLDELRKRLAYSAATVAFFFSLLWIIREDVIYVLSWPLQSVIRETGHQVIMLSVMDKVFIHLKTVFATSVLLSIPFLTIQVWKFLVPALYQNEKRYTLLFFVLGILLFSAGVVLCYFFTLPYAFSFLINYSTETGNILFEGGAVNGASLNIALKDHINLTINMLLVFGTIFELPLLMIFLGKLGIVESSQLKKMRKHAIVGGMIFAAVITPPDPVTMIALAIPIVVLFEIGLLLVAFNASDGVARPHC